MGEYCSNQWAEPPDGMPTWCITAEWTWNLWLQLALELLILLVLAWLASMAKRWWVARKREKDRQKYHEWKRTKGLV
tara:strand:- start:3996 stop:4226 length:231 start_codon:yes stop_codon:yes gene_type:complete